MAPTPPHIASSTTPWVFQSPRTVLLSKYRGNYELTYCSIIFSLPLNVTNPTTQPGRALLGCSCSDTSSLQPSSHRSAPSPMDPDISLGLTSAVVPAYNAYTFGCYYDVYDPDWSALTLTNFLWWTSAHGLVSLVTELLVRPQCSQFFARALYYLRYAATMFYSLCLYSARLSLSY